MELKLKRPFYKGSSGLSGGGGGGSSALKNDFNALMNNPRTSIEKSDFETYRLMAAAQAETPELPAFTGTDKQVKWAEGIRDSAFASLDSYAKNTAAMGWISADTPYAFHDLTDDRRAILEEIPKTKAALGRIFKSEMANETPHFGSISIAKTSAGKIIDLRNNFAGDTVQTAVKNIAEVRRKAKSAGRQDVLDRLGDPKQYDAALRRQLGLY